MAQQPMTQFWPIFASKSDGQHIVSIKSRPLRNGPTEEQLNTAPNDQGQRDFYRLIEKDDPKHIDWRKKLGGMLLRETGGKQHEDRWQQCILWELPENYILYEHIKTKADGQLKTVKNHSGGGHDRQDAYLYGYPKGPKKRFRSPVEFFPHLLWLCTDENSDHANCTCKMCSPAGDVERPQFKAEVKPELPALIKREPSSTAIAPGNSVVGRDPVIQIPARRPSSGAPAPSPVVKPATPVPTARPAPVASQIRPPPSQHSSLLPQPRSLEQQTDLSYNKFLCRVGEVVWFHRTKTGAWGLGLVVRRWTAKESPASRFYLIQRLSHPLETAEQELVTDDSKLKPWLAWCPPGYILPFLQQNPQLGYRQVEWGVFLSPQYGQDSASVDASILAAKAVDSTYTLFDRLKASRDDHGNEYRHYNAIFIGSEKVWRGEAVRLRIGSGTDLLVVTDIVEQLSSDGSRNVAVVGDMYGYATLPVLDMANPPRPPQLNSNIPTRMVHDMAWRNNMLVPLAHQLAWWKLLKAGTKLDISEIKGRWYETSIVFQDPFEKAVRNNEGGNGIWLNSRGDATGMGKNAGKHLPDRIAALGASVPPGTQLVEGFEPPAQNVGQSQMSREMHVLDMSGGGTVDPFSIDEFMNVDHLGDDIGMDFGDSDNFSFQ